MQKFSRFIMGVLLLGAPLFSQQPVVTAPVAQGDIDYSDKRDPDVDDMEALRRWIRDKRLVTVKEIGGDLSISGEVRVEFQDTSEVKNKVSQRGKGSATTKPQYAWDVEVNLMVDYRTDRTWAAIKLEFDNDMGIRSGTLNKIRLEKAYLGGRLVPGDTFTLDAEIGRRFLYNVYDSKVEFSSLFDGVLFRFNKAWEAIGNFYFNPGALLVNDLKSHYAYVFELGGLRIGNTGLNMKYSVIDWYKPTANKLTRRRYKFIVSQFLTSYQFYPEWIGKKMVKFYAAGLTNHLGKGVPQTQNRRQNYAWYSGVSIGLVKKKHDWAIDANYQWVQAQAVPEFDCSGIGLGNAAGVGFYTNKTDGDPKSGAPDRREAVGSCNYKGFEVEALYAFTDNLTVLQNLKYSRTLNKAIGPKDHMHYKQYEVEFIYAF